MPDSPHTPRLNLKQWVTKEARAEFCGSESVSDGDAHHGTREKKHIDNAVQLAQKKQERRCFILSASKSRLTSEFAVKIFDNDSLVERIATYIYKP
jgi:hypothetical protein